MRDQRQIRSFSIQGLVWVVSCACAPMPPAKPARAENAHSFAVQHGTELEREVGSGGGPSVRTLAILAKCPNIISAARLLTDQKDSIYPAPSAEVAADRLVAVLARSEGLGCSAANGGNENVKPGAIGKHGEAPAKNAADRANMKEQYGE
jgi:hypothetical protein